MSNWKDVINSQIDKNDTAVKDSISKIIQRKSVELLNQLRKPVSTEPDKEPTIDDEKS